MTGDVYIGGEPYIVHDDEKMLEHAPCGTWLFGDSKIAAHTCAPCPGCLDYFETLPVVDAENGDRYCSDDCHDNAAERYWTAVWSA